MLTYLPQYNVLYCRIQKAGSSTWLLGTFIKLAEQSGFKFNQKTSQKQQLVQHFKVKNMKMLNKILKRNPLAFANVRHPFERLVSAYLDKELIEVTGLTGKSFKEFVTQTVLKKTKASKNRHWHPYNDHCNVCNVPYNVISKTETFDEDRRRILGMLGVEEKEEVVRRHVHGGDHIQQMTKKFFNKISQQVKTKLLHLYKYEFAMFNYDTHLY